MMKLNKTFPAYKEEDGLPVEHQSGQNLHLNDYYKLKTSIDYFQPPKLYPVFNGYGDVTFYMNTEQWGEKKMSLDNGYEGLPAYRPSTETILNNIHEEKKVMPKNEDLKENLEELMDKSRFNKEVKASEFVLSYSATTGKSN